MKCKVCNYNVKEHDVGSELDACIVKSVMGWKIWNGIETGRTDYPRYANVDGDVVVYKYDNWFSYFTPSENIVDALMAEDRIDELGLRDLYITHLAEIIEEHQHSKDLTTKDGLWYMVHASPYERCLASLLTINSKKE